MRALALGLALVPVAAAALGFEPSRGGSLEARVCTPAPEDARLPAGAASEWPLPPICGQEFEGSCVSRDGRVRISIRFEGRRAGKRVRSGFYGGEGWMNDTFYTGTRTLSIEHVATRRSALFVERLRDSRGYTAPGAQILYLPGKDLVLFLGAGAQGRAVNSYCIRLQ